MHKRIYIKEWLMLKPYDNQSMTDVYYLELSNKVKQAITSDKQLFIPQQYLDKAEINLLACFLASYFEDVISGTNIWNSFITIHHRLYQKQLPFYMLDDYYREEINFEDVSFLIWYFLNTVQTEKFIAPFNDFIYEKAEKVMEVLDDAWEYAPENEHLKSYYNIDHNENDFYIARNLIKTILFKTYLFHTDTLFKLKENEFEIVQKNKNDRNLMAFLNMNKDTLIHENKTRLLNLTGKEWTAEILGKQHPLSEEFLNISQKINGYFFYKGQDQENIFIEHIASDKKFKLTKKSFDDADYLVEIDTIVFIGIIKWKGEWWFSGYYFQIPFNADLVLDEKNSQESRNAVSFLDDKQDKIEELLDKQLQAFKEFNNGSPIAFLPTDKIDDFCKSYFEFYNASLNRSAKKIETAKKNIRENSVFGDKEDIQNLAETFETGLVFFNPKGGIQIALNINSAFPLENNPYYKEENSKEHTVQLLMQNNYAPELVMFCIDNCKNKLSFFNDELGEVYLKNIDFLLRFWKTNNYETQPLITYAK